MPSRADSVEAAGFGRPGLQLVLPKKWLTRRCGTVGIHSFGQKVLLPLASRFFIPHDRRHHQYILSRHKIVSRFLYFSAKMLRAYKTDAGHQRENQARANRRKVKSRLHDAVIRVYDDGGNVIETYEHARQI